MAALTRRLVRVAAVVLVVYAGLIALTGWQFNRAPTGFIPEQDQGYLITVSSCRRARRWRAPTRWCRRRAQIILEIDGVAHAVRFAGFDGATFTNASNAGAIFSACAPFEERARAGPHDAGASSAELSQRLRRRSRRRCHPRHPCRRRCAASAPAAASR